MGTPRKGYYLPDGTKVPSVTTMTGRFKDGGALQYWSWETGYEQCRRGDGFKYMDLPVKAAEIGTMAHKMIEHHISELPPPVFEDVTPEMIAKAKQAFDNYLNWEKQTGLEILCKYQELQLVSLEYQYGGTPDAIGTIDGQLVLIDWKTSAGIYPDYLIQLAAYKHLIDFGVRLDNYESLNKSIDGGFHICRFPKDFADFEHRYYAELDTAWEQFKRFRECYEADKELKKRSK